MARQHHKLLQCLVILVLLSHSNEAVVATKFTTKRLLLDELNGINEATKRMARSRNSSQQVSRTLPKNISNFRGNRANLPLKKAPKTSNLLNLLNRTATPTISMHPTPARYALDDDSYFNTTTQPTPSLKNKNQQTPKPAPVTTPYVKPHSPKKFSSGISRNGNSTIASATAAIPTSYNSSRTEYPLSSFSSNSTLPTTSYSMMLPSFLLVLTFNNSNEKVDGEHLGEITAKFLEVKIFKRKYGSNFTGIDLQSSLSLKTNTSQDNVVYSFECIGLAKFVNFIPKKNEVDGVLIKSLQKKNIYSYFEENCNLSCQNHLTNVSVDLKYEKSLSPPFSANLSSSGMPSSSNIVNNTVYAAVAGALTAILLSVLVFAVFVRWSESSRQPLEYHDATNRDRAIEETSEEACPDIILLGTKKKNLFSAIPSDSSISMSNDNVSEFASDIQPYGFNRSTVSEYEFDLQPSESLLSPNASEIWAEFSERDLSSHVGNECSTVDVCLDAKKCFPSPMTSKKREAPPSTPESIVSYWQFTLSGMRSFSSMNSSNSPPTENNKVTNDVPSLTNAVDATLQNSNIGVVAKKVRNFLDKSNKTPGILGLQDDASSLSGASIDERFYFASEKNNDVTSGGFMYI